MPRLWLLLAMVDVAGAMRNVEERSMGGMWEMEKDRSCRGACSRVRILRRSKFVSRA